MNESTQKLARLLQRNEFKNLGGFEAEDVLDDFWNSSVDCATKAAVIIVLRQQVKVAEENLAQLKWQLEQRMKEVDP